MKMNVDLINEVLKILQKMIFSIYETNDTSVKLIYLINELL